MRTFRLLNCIAIWACLKKNSPPPVKKEEEETNKWPSFRIYQKGWVPTLQQNQKTATPKRKKQRKQQRRRTPPKKKERGETENNKEEQSPTQKKETENNQGEEPRARKTARPRVFFVGCAHGSAPGRRCPGRSPGSCTSSSTGPPFFGAASSPRVRAKDFRSQQVERGKLYIYIYICDFDSRNKRRKEPKYSALIPETDNLCCHKLPQQITDAETQDLSARTRIFNLAHTEMLIPVLISNGQEGDMVGI